MRRVFVSPPELRPGELLLDVEEARYVARVLRLAAGDRVELFDGAGRRAGAELLAVDRREVRCLASAVVEDPPPPGPRLTSLVPLLKGERLDLCLRMLTELGVHAVQLVSCERSVVQPDDEDARLARLQRVVLAAARQSGRAQVPPIAPCVALAEAVAQVEGPAWFGDVAASAEGAPLPGLADVDRAWVCTGPEGGFGEAERALLLARGLQPLRLGPHVLRAETAAVVALAALQQAAAGR
jgi:16S rRNA (uracil1498-N3)-methyltransferase